MLLQPPKALGGPQNSCSRLSATSLRRERKLRRRARIGTQCRPQVRRSALAGRLGLSNAHFDAAMRRRGVHPVAVLARWRDAQRSATLDLASPEGREAGDAVHGARLALEGNGAVVLARQVEAERQQRGLLARRRRRRHMVRQRLAGGAQHGRAQRPEVVHHQRSAAGRAGAARQRRWGRNGSRS